MGLLVDTDSKRFWIGIGVTVIGLGENVLAPIFPHWVGWALIGLGIVIIFWPLIHSFATFPNALVNIPMRDAALKLYESVENHFVGRVAHRMGENEDETLGYFFHAMVMDGVPIYGRKPPSTILRKIPSEEIAKLYPLIGLDAAGYLTDGDKAAYTMLTIKRWDLLREMRRLRRRSAGVAV